VNARPVNNVMIADGEPGRMHHHPGSRRAELIFNDLRHIQRFVSSFLSTAGEQDARGCASGADMRPVRPAGEVAPVARYVAGNGMRVDVDWTRQ